MFSTTTEAPLDSSFIRLLTTIILSFGTREVAMSASHSDHAANGVREPQRSALCTVEDFVSRDYDYLVVGGGTAGLVVAARLTENSSVSVGVVEAGKNRMDDDLVSTPGAYPALIGRKEYDWCWESVAQVLCNSDPTSLPASLDLVGALGANSDIHPRRVPGTRHIRCREESSLVAPAGSTISCIHAQAVIVSSLGSYW